MIIANTQIIVGEKTFKKGQAVTGLSSFDKDWMKRKGYITESTKETKPKGNAKDEEKVDE